MQQLPSTDSSSNILVVKPAVDWCELPSGHSMQPRADWRPARAGAVAATMQARGYHTVQAACHLLYGGDDLPCSPCGFDRAYNVFFYMDVKRATAAGATDSQTRRVSSLNDDVIAHAAAYMAEGVAKLQPFFVVCTIGALVGSQEYVRLMDRLRLELQQLSIEHNTLIFHAAGVAHRVVYEAA